MARSHDSASDAGASPRAPGERLRALYDRLAPFVLVYREIPGLGAPSLSIDNHAGIGEIVAHLTGLGHRRVAYLAGPPGSAGNAERLAALRAAPGLDLTVLPCGSMFDDGHAAADHGVDPQERAGPPGVGAALGADERRERRLQRALPAPPAHPRQHRTGGLAHHSAKEPSEWRQMGPRQRWPRSAALSTACSSMSMPSPGRVVRVAYPAGKVSGAGSAR